MSKLTRKDKIEIYKRRKKVKQRIYTSEPDTKFKINNLRNYILFYKCSSFLNLL